MYLSVGKALQEAQEVKKKKDWDGDQGEIWTRQWRYIKGQEVTKASADVCHHCSNSILRSSEVDLAAWPLLTNSILHPSKVTVIADRFMDWIHWQFHWKLDENKWINTAFALQWRAQVAVVLICEQVTMFRQPVQEWQLYILRKESHCRADWPGQSVCTIRV